MMKIVDVDNEGVEDGNDGARDVQMILIEGNGRGMRQYGA